MWQPATALRYEIRAGYGYLGSKEINDIMLLAGGLVAMSNTWLYSNSFHLEIVQIEEQFERKTFGLTANLEESAKEVLSEGS